MTSEEKIFNFRATEHVKPMGKSAVHTYFGEISSDNCTDIAMRVLKSTKRSYPIVDLYNFQVCQLLRLGEMFELKSTVSQLTISDHQPGVVSNHVVLYEGLLPIEYQRSMLELCIPHVRTLNITAHFRAATELFINLLDAAAMHATHNMTELHISWSTRSNKTVLAAMSRLIQKLGPNLKYLRLHLGPYPRNSIVFTKSLLTAIANSCTQLEHFEYNAHCLHLLNSFWRHAGPSLTSLEIFCPPRLAWNEPIDAIEKFCCRLTNVKLHGAPTQAYHRLLCSIGNRLVETMISDELNPLPNCETLLIHCPNASFDFRSNFDDDQLESLRWAVASLFVNVQSERHIDRLCGVLKLSACRLRTINLILNYSSNDIISQLIVHSMPQLESFSIHVLPSITRTNLLPLVKATSKLRLLHLGVTNITDFAAFDNLCTANPELDDVVVRFHSQICPEQQKRIAIGVLNSMSSCRKLSSLQLSSETESINEANDAWLTALPEINDACLSLRRHASVRVFKFLPDY